MSASPAHLLTMPEAARYVGRPRGFILRLIAEGKVSSMKVGARRYVSRSALDALSGHLPDFEAPPGPVVVSRFPRALRRS